MEKLIILIDDNEIDNFINRMTLKQAGFTGKFMVYQSAVLALEYLKELSHHTSSPDLVFLDIQMPVMNGVEFLSEFTRLNAQIKNKTKIVVLTSSLDPQDIQNCKKYPEVVNFINKPLTREKMSQVTGLTDLLS